MAEKNQTTAGVTGEAAAALPQPQQQGRPCPKDCRRCSMAQQICCASMLSFQMYDVINSVIARLDLQSQRMYEMEKRLSVIQSSDAELAAPAPIQGDLFAEENQE